ncbi:hypothetical protein D5018_02625 [Parashewanella curva]|uniref:Uncharacterized protein n=1 Tax=Parashewanella curva TaxID=2338552 RepID=A0A3L8Q2C9_9GAMM|nr:hypothetical protein [Parashewanella curva]RLV61169.1 hypothetical protein D5018_02625 [Parashewanella curva]
MLKRNTKITTITALLASVLVCSSAMAERITLNLSSSISNLPVNIGDNIEVVSPKPGRLINVSKEAYDSCDIDAIKASRKVMGDFASNEGELRPVILLIKKFPPLDIFPIYRDGKSNYFIVQDDEDSNQRCLANDGKFTLNIIDPNRPPKRYSFDITNPIPNLSVRLNDVLAVNSVEKGRLIRVSKEAFETCNIDAIKQSRLTIGDFEPKDGEPWTLYINVRKLHGGLDGIPTYKKGHTYYYIVQDDKNSNQKCLDGNGKFTFTTEGKEPLITQEDIDKSLVADIRMINHVELNKHKHTGEYRVRSIDKDGRIKLSYLNGIHFNHTNVPSRRNKVFWVVMQNDVRYVYSGQLGWHAKDGGYAFLIRDNSSDPYPKVNSGFVIESIH